jgi:battenin
MIYSEGFTPSLQVDDGESAKETLNERVDRFRAQFFAAFFIVGLFNNNGYVLV